MVQWVVAYVAAGCVVLQVMEGLADIWAVPVRFQRGASLAIGLGLLHSVVLAWYHGEKGRQSVCALEMVVLGALTALAAVVIRVVCA